MSLRTEWPPAYSARAADSRWPADRALPAGWSRQPATAGRADPGSSGDVFARPGLHDAVLAMAARRPDAPAVRQGDAALSYRELAAATLAAADRLRRAGVGRGHTVGLHARRTPDLVVAVLGVLACGAAYVPLDPAYPIQRLTAIGAESRLALLLTDGPPDDLEGVVAPAVGDLGVGTVAGNVGPRAWSRSATAAPAYVMFTSGSTGRPKGVVVSHDSMLTFLDAMTELLPAQAADRVLVSTRLSFDIAGLEIFLPLVRGGVCVLAEETRLPRPAQLADLVGRTHPTLVQATPVVWRMLLKADVRIDADATVLCGGEALPPDLAEALAGLRCAAAYNLYGPTEATVWATAWPVRSGAPVRIGTCLRHAHTYVLDDRLDPVVPGQEGELYLGGSAVSAGYLGRPELTSVAFLPDPFSATAGLPMYATGDVVRERDGQLEWVRRNDSQVKVQGNRIELGEVERLATACDGVAAAAAAVVASGGDGELHLFLVPDGAGAPDARAVRAELARALPPSHVPRHVHTLDALPLTENSKVDRRELGQRALAICLS